MRSAVIAICLVLFCLQYITSVNSTCLFNDCPDYNSLKNTSLSYNCKCYDLNHTPYICGINNVDYSFQLAISSMNTDVVQSSCVYNGMNNTFLSSTSSPLTYICVYSCQVNCSCPPPPMMAIPPLLINTKAIVAFNVVMLLAVVLPVITANIAILVVLALESSIVKIIRLILANILISGLVDAFGLGMFHITSTVSPFVALGLSLFCTTAVSVTIAIFGWTARSVFMATFAIVVYIIVKHGSDTKKCLVVVVLVVVVLWVITFLVTSPMFSICTPSATVLPSIGTYLFVHLFIFSLVPPFVAVTFLIVICCKNCSIASATAVEKTMVKFGFFLLLAVVGNGVNYMIGVVVPSLITSIIGTTASLDLEGLQNVHYAAYTLLNVGLIPTPILIVIFFKSIRKRLLHWLCCCIAKKRKAKRNHNNSNNNGEGRMVTATD